MFANNKWLLGKLIHTQKEKEENLHPENIQFKNNPYGFKMNKSIKKALFSMQYKIFTNYVSILSYEYNKQSIYLSVLECFIKKM